VLAHHFDRARVAGVARQADSVTSRHPDPFDELVGTGERACRQRDAGAETPELDRRGGTYALETAGDDSNGTGLHFYLLGLSLGVLACCGERPYCWRGGPARGKA
jgi:hypothetical protein